jgi:DNA-binding NtrC family response regulator
MGPILIVDDEPSIRQLIGRWLSDAGYQFAEAESAAAALEAMKTSPAPVVLCDVQMPGHDGLWLTRQVRTEYPSTAVVLATGITTIPPSVSMQAGVLAYLVKPFVRETLLAAVREGLDWHERANTSPRSTSSADELEKWLEKLEKG